MLLTMSLTELKCNSSLFSILRIKKIQVVLIDKKLQQNKFMHSETCDTNYKTKDRGSLYLKF